MTTDLSSMLVQGELLISYLSSTLAQGGPLISYLLLILGVTLGGVAAAYGTVSLVASLIAARGRDRRRTRPKPLTMPPISVLKPLHGAEPRLYENLRSFCAQDYPCFQLLCGVRDTNDAAITAVRQLQQEFPELDIQLVVDPRIHGRNHKVSNLTNVLEHARYPLLVVADSDIEVGPDYLERVCLPLLQPATGIVTCLYRSRAIGGLWARLGALFIDEWFRPSVHIAHLLGSRSFAFGATIALSRTTLDAIGGFPAITNELADDYRLGELTRDLGLRTVLSDYVVVTDVTEHSAAALLRRELRWLRTIRTLNPAGYSCMAVSFNLVLAIIGTLLASGTPVALGLLAWAVGTRLVLHWMAARDGGQNLWQMIAALPLLPLRDALSLALWGVGFLRRRVAWAGQNLQFNNKGLFHDAAP